MSITVLLYFWFLLKQLQFKTITIASHNHPSLEALPWCDVVRGPCICTSCSAAVCTPCKRKYFWLPPCQNTRVLWLSEVKTKHVGQRVKQPSAVTIQITAEAYGTMTTDWTKAVKLLSALECLAGQNLFPDNLGSSSWIQGYSQQVKPYNKSVVHTNLYMYACMHICYLNSAYAAFLLDNLMMCANEWIHYGPMAIFVCLHLTLPHYNRYANVSEGIEILKCLSVESVSKIKSILLIIFHVIYGAVCIQLSLMIIMRICVLLIIITKSDLWPTCQCLCLDNGTMVCVVCLSIFLCFLII